MRLENESKMAAPMSVRVRLRFSNSCSSLFNCGNNDKLMFWYLVDKTVCNQINDVISCITARFGKKGVPVAQDVSLWLDECVVPAWESVDILRDNDILTIRLDRSCDYLNISGKLDISTNKTSVGPGRKHKLCESTDQELNIENGETEPRKRYKKKRKFQKESCEEAEYVDCDKNGDSLHLSTKKKKKQKKHKNKYDSPKKTLVVQNGGSDDAAVKPNHATQSDTADSEKEEGKDKNHDIMTSNHVLESPVKDNTINCQQNTCNLTPAVCKTLLVKENDGSQVQQVASLDHSSNVSIQEKEKESVNGQNESVVVKKKRRRRKKNSRKPPDSDETQDCKKNFSTHCPQVVNTSFKQITPLNIVQNSQHAGMHTVFDSDSEDVSKVTQEQFHTLQSKTDHVNSASEEAAGNLFPNTETSQAISQNSVSNQPVSNLQPTNINTSNSDIVQGNNSGFKKNNNTKTSKFKPNAEMFAGVQVFDRRKNKKKSFYALSKEEQLNTVATNRSVVIQNGVGDQDERCDNKEDEPNTSVTTQDYTVFPVLHAPPRVGDNIAFKLLEMSAGYSPEISNYKEGTVVSYNIETHMFQVKLRSCEKKRGHIGKFDIVIESEEEIFTNTCHDMESLVSLEWSSLLEPRLIIEQPELQADTASSQENKNIAESFTNCTEMNQVPAP